MLLHTSSTFKKKKKGIKFALSFSIAVNQYDPTYHKSLSEKNNSLINSANTKQECC